MDDLRHQKLHAITLSILRRKNKKRQSGYKPNDDESRELGEAEGMGKKLAHPNLTGPN